jgi:hypothetical protein
MPMTSTSTSHAKDDVDREIHLTLIPFALRTQI